MNKQMTHFYEFGEFRLEPSRRRFSQNGTAVPLTPKALDLLVVLLQNHGRVLEKRYLLEQAWPDVIVEEHSLTQAISVLRKILGDKPNSHNYIKTVPGRGYQFIASVKEVTEEDEPVAGVPDTRPLLRTFARRPYFAATFMLIGILVGIVPPWLSGNASRDSAPGSARLTSVAAQPLHSGQKESCKGGAVTARAGKQSCANKCGPREGR